MKFSYPFLSLLAMTVLPLVADTTCTRRDARPRTAFGESHPPRLLCRSLDRAGRREDLRLRHARSVGRRDARLLGILRLQKLDLPRPELADEDGLHQPDLESPRASGRPRSRGQRRQIPHGRLRRATRSGPAWPTIRSARGATPSATARSFPRTTSPATT